MKQTKQTIIALLTAFFIIFSASCKKNPLKKSLKETLIEHDWVVTEWMSYPGQIEPTPEEDLYERYFDEDCKRNSYSEYLEDGTVLFHNLCYDTVTSSTKWAVEGNEKLILTYPLWDSELQEYNGDTTYTWEVLDYSRKKIELKMDYIHYGGGGSQTNYTETKTLEAL